MRSTFVFNRMILYKYDKSVEAIHAQIKLLELQYQHIGELITFTRKIIKKGVQTMNSEVFNSKEIEQYKDEVKAKLG